MLTREQLLNAPEEDYMNEEQLAFFKQLLLDLRAQTVKHLKETKHRLAFEEREADELDQAWLEEENILSLRIADRESKLLPKIDAALKRIEEGTYGYCEETGEPIGIRRLLLRPTATLCAEEKARQERIESLYRD